MDRAEQRYQSEARKQDMSLDKNEDGTWSLGPGPAVVPLVSNDPVMVTTYLSEGRIRINGREFPRRMTTAELKEALGITDEEPAGG